MHNIRNFFIAFLVSVLAFSVLAWFLMGKVTNNVEDEIISPNIPVISDDNKPGNSIIEKDIAGNSFTALLACADPLTGRHDSLMILHVDKERKQYMISSLPSYMVLNIDSIEYYLGDLIKEKGRDFLLNKVYAITGLNIDYYAFVSIEGFAKIIDEIGGVTFTVPQNMFYRDHLGNVLVDLKKGTKKLSGNEALQLLRFKGYSNGDEERRNVQRDFVLTTLDTILVPSNLGNAPAVLEKLLKYTNTNFTVNDFKDNIDLIFKYNSFEKIEIDYPGVSNNNNEVVRFIPIIDEAIEIYKDHR